MLPDWEKPDTIPPPTVDEVQVWRMRLERPIEGCLSYLNDAERDRARRYRVASARDEFVAGRSALRLLLAHALNQSPASIAIEAGAHGKPAISGTEIQFNVSHSGGNILIALCRGGSIGVDTERVADSPELAQIAADSFTPRELATLTSAPTREEWLNLFYRCWTQKEAVTKVDGRGLNLPLASFEVPIRASADGSLVTVEGTDTIRVYEIPVEEDCVAALAVETGKRCVRLLDLDRKLFHFETVTYL